MHSSESDRASDDTKVLHDEDEWLKKRSKRTDAPALVEDGERVGLALSGGGIRSSTFNLGVLQALQRYRVLERVDYLSTVSGGGFIGSSLTWLMTRLNVPYPFGRTRADHRLTLTPRQNGVACAAGSQAPGPADTVGWLRQHGEYLAPHPPLTRWALLSAIVRGAVISLLVFLLPVFAVLVIVQQHVPWAFAACFYLALVAGALLLAWYLVQGGLSGRWPPTPNRRNTWDGWQGRLLMAGVMLMGVGLLPQVHRLMLSLLEPGVVTGTSGVALIALSRWRALGSDETKGARGLLLYLGLFLAVYGVLLVLYWQATAFPPLISWAGLGLLILLLITLALWVLVDINQVSMLRFYRDRLRDAFMPRVLCRNENPEKLWLHDLVGADGGPYHLLNVNMVTVDSDNPTLRLRCGENFLLSPLYCGSRATGYRSTKWYQGGGLDLATACAVSGAAVASHTRFLRARTAAILMTLLNLSIGYWVRNPRFATSKNPANVGYSYALSAMLGRVGPMSGLSEDAEHVHLTDGGHFENLGAYELIRRRCRLIIILDAGADPDWQFKDLSNLVQRVRLDFGAAVEIDPRPLRPRGEHRISESSFVIGRVRYLPLESGEKSEGVILYIKTCVVSGLPEDIYGYRRSDPAFPDTPTSNQFFREDCFEAYRELGYRLAERACLAPWPVPQQAS